MALVRYEPWSLVARLQGEINRTLNDWGSNETSGATADWIPAADVDEYRDRFELFVDLPGVAADQVDITLESGVLTLSGERRATGMDEQLTSHRRERDHGHFHRRFILPNTVDAEGVTASERNGVLEITIPKQAAAQPRRIKVAA
jgi:HSP20 family protein